MVRHCLDASFELSKAALTLAGRYYGLCTWFSVRSHGPMHQPWCGRPLTFTKCRKGASTKGTLGSTLFDLVIKETVTTSPHNILGDDIPIKVPRTVATDGVIAANTEFAPA